MKIPVFQAAALLVGASILFASCLKPRQMEPRETFPAQAEGWVPIYYNDGLPTDIKAGKPVPIEKGGKIYVKGDILYQVETGRGIHVTDVSNPANPVRTAFINVAGAQEIAIKDNMLYTNNLNDFVVLDISNISAVKAVTRLKNAFHLFNPSYPPGGGYFECVDPAKGEVIGWEPQTIDSPKCVR